jgi:DNA polymerase
MDATRCQLLKAADVAGVCHGGFVWGEGPTSSRIVFVGEAPGASEVKVGRPFVGQAGRNLDDFLSMAGLCRDDIYVTNAVKFRPVKQGKRGLVNRPPSMLEIRLCSAFLAEEIARIGPLLVVTLGNVPLKALAGDGLTIGQVHGTTLPLRQVSEQTSLFPLYHPASIIYNKRLAEVYQMDIAQLADVVKWML